MKAIILMPWGRVGSNLLMSYLRKAIKGKFANESLNKIKTPHDQHEWLSDFFSGDDKFICTKESTTAIINNDFVSDWLLSHDIRTVRMFRRNLFKATLSQMRAELYASKTQQEIGRPLWAVAKDATPLPATPIDPDVFLKRFRVFEAQTLQLRETYEKTRHIDVYYEDLNGDLETTLHAVSEFLGLETTPFEPPYRKATPDNAEDVISNAKELEQRLRGEGLVMLDLLAIR